jgi:hypothetical protein
MNHEVPLQDAIQKIYYWQYHYTHCFSDLIFDLCPKADLYNFGLLARGFPAHCQAWSLWQACEDPVQFFKEWNVWPEGKL